MGYKMESDSRRREGAQLLLRFAEGSDLREVLRKKAAQNGRTLTAEILYRLEKSLEDDGLSAAVAHDDDFREKLDQRLRTERWEMQQSLNELRGKIEALRAHLGLTDGD